jgi:hypothetical protein
VNALGGRITDESYSMICSSIAENSNFDYNNVLV